LHYRKRRKNHTGPPVFFTSPTKRHHFVQVPFGIQENSLLFAEKNGAIEAGNQHNPEFCWLNHCLTTGVLAHVQLKT
jgi:hypothetical protein